jgi:hypothetical protein
MSTFINSNQQLIHQFTEFTQEFDDNLKKIVHEIILKLEDQKQQKLKNDEFYLEFFKEKHVPFKLDETDTIFYSMYRNPSL